MNAGNVGKINNGAKERENVSVNLDSIWLETNANNVELIKILMVQHVNAALDFLEMG
jgi:hypothetical protein